LNPSGGDWLTAAVRDSILYHGVGTRRAIGSRVR
jgi:hypothetical protein